MSANKDVIASQYAVLSQAVGKLLPAGSNYALLDFPHYANVGDSALWLGGLQLLTAIAGKEPGYVCSTGTFDAERLRRAVPDGPIFLSGGGNFGDIWKSFQVFREMIMHTFPGRLVVQLPQSISFTEEAAIEQCARAIAAHGNFHLFVRDANSLAFAQNHFACPSELVPDLAFALGPLERPVSPNRDVFMLLREDCERATYDRAPLYAIPGAVAADWLDEPKNYSRSTKLSAAVNAMVSGAWSPEARRLVFYRQLASGRIKRGATLLSSGQRVIADRLHAHILAVLLDIPHVALDNNYGKISGYIASWTHAYPGLQTASSAEEAIAKLALLPGLKPALAA